MILSPKTTTETMNFFNLLKIALRALNRNKLRAILTMLGIIIGIAAVICMLAIGQGSKESIKAQISEMGSNMIMIHPGNMQRGGVRQSADDMQTLKISDYETLRGGWRNVYRGRHQVRRQGLRGR